MASTSKRVARKRHLNYLMIRSAFARSHVTFWLFVAVCADASLPQVDFPWTGFLGMHNAVRQTVPMHSVSLL